MRELPTSQEIENVVKLSNLLTPYYLNSLRDAQHRATRRATLEEVRTMTGPATPLLNAWLTTQLEAVNGEMKVMAKRVRVRLLESGRLAGRGRWGRVGDEITVPKSALSRGVR